MSEIKGCMNCGNISCGNNKKRDCAGCGRWISPEDKIAELEKENERLTVDYETLKLNDEEEIGMLKSEDAELKEKLKPENCLKLLAKEGYIKFTSEQLTKAKELLKRYVPYRQITDSKAYKDLADETEQFLEEIEK